MRTARGVEPVRRPCCPAMLSTVAAGTDADFGALRALL